MKNDENNKKSVKSNNCSFTLIVVISTVLISAIIELLLIYFDTFPAFKIEPEYLKTVNISVFSGIMVIAIFSGTIISYAKDSCGNMYGLKKNEIMMFAYNLGNKKILKSINIGSMIKSTVILMALSIFPLYSQLYNAMGVILIVSIGLNILEMYLSIKIILKEDIEKFAKNYFLQKFIGTEKALTTDTLKSAINAVLDTIKENYLNGNNVYLNEIEFIYEIKAKVEEAKTETEEAKANEKDFNNAFFTTIDASICKFVNELQKDRKIDFVDKILFDKRNYNSENTDIYCFLAIGIIVDNSSGQTKKVFDLLSAWFNKFVRNNFYSNPQEQCIAQGQYIEYMKRLYFKVNSNEDKKLLIIEFIEIINNDKIEKRFELFYFAIKNLVENSDPLLSEILRIYMAGQNKDKKEIIIDLAIYFNYIFHSDVIPQRIKSVLNIALEEKLYGYESFKNFLKKCSGEVKYHDNNILEGLEYTANNIDYVAYMIQLNQYYVAKHKVYFAILYKEISINFNEYKYQEILEYREMFENTDELKKANADELNNLASFYKFGEEFDANDYKNLYEDIDKKYWKAEQENAKEIKDKFNTNVLPDLEQLIKEHNGNLGNIGESNCVPKKFSIVNFCQQGKAENLWKLIIKEFGDKGKFQIEEIKDKKTALENTGLTLESDEINTTNGIFVKASDEEVIEYQNNRYIVIKHTQLIKDNL